VSRIRLSLAVSLALCLTGLMTSRSAQAQVFEVSGGNSSLYQAGGGSITMQGSNFNMTIGAGTVDGHLLEGIRTTKNTPRGALIFGDDRIDFRLPTDIFDTSHYLEMRGIGFNPTQRNADILLYAGATSEDSSGPFFNGAKATEPAFLFFLKKKLGPKWQIYSDSIFSNKLTQIEAVEWTPLSKLEIAAAAGLGANEPFGAVSLNFARPRIDVQAAFITAGTQFHRITGAAPQLAEPDRENVNISVRPWNFLTLGGSHQNFLVPEYPSPVNTRSSIDEGMASLHFLGAQFNGSAYHSSYDQPGYSKEFNHAVALTAMRDFGSRIRLNTNYFVSKPAGLQSVSSFVASITESLNAHISVTENLTYSNGRTSANFGGEFLSNRFSFSANYQTFYVPALNAQPFEQSLLLDVKLKVLGRLLLHGATFVDPTGKLRYTADGQTIVSHDQHARNADQVSLGRYVMRGCVIDSEGTPIEGAAMMIDERPIYTDSSGCFSIRENKPRQHHLSLVTSDFLIGGQWEVSTMPATIVSTTEEQSGEATVIIVVRRIPIVSATPTASGASSTRSDH
jgi:hypothetical protein